MSFPNRLPTDPPDEKAPPGKIRFIGIEHEVSYLIADLDAPMTTGEIRARAHLERCVGTEVWAYDDQGECLHSA